MKALYSGRCACGALRYRCTDAPLAMINCHCLDCQRSSGAPYASGFVVPVGAIDIDGVTSSFSSRAASGSMSTRMFCPSCGSPMFATSDGSGGFMSVRFSTLDDTSWFEPRADVWIIRAQTWTCMNASLPHFAQGPT